MKPPIPLNRGKLLFFLTLLCVVFLYHSFHDPQLSAGPANLPVVKFNGVDAEVISSSSKMIKAKVPVGATTGPVSVGGIQFSEEDFEVIYKVKKDDGAPGAKETAPTPAPTGVAVRSSVSNIEVSWTPPIAEGLTGYNIYRSAGEKGTYALIKPDVINTFYLDESKDLQQGGKYFYSVTAVYGKSAGKDLESDRSVPGSAVFGTISLWIPNVNGAQEKTQGKALKGQSLLQVPVNIENADKLTINEMEIYIDYDSSILKPSSVEKTILAVDYDWTLSTLSDGTVKISLKKGVNKPLRGVGTLFNVVFEIIDSGAEGKVVNFSFHGENHASPSYVRTFEGNSIPLKLSNGALKVQLKFRKGDVTGDTSVYADDSGAAFVYSMGLLEPGEGPLAGGDIDGDGSIMTNDSGLILYYVVNNDWPSLQNLAVFKEKRTIDLGAKRLVSKLMAPEQLRASFGAGGENKNTAKSESAEKRYLQAPIYINTLNDMNSAEFNVVYPSETLQIAQFTMDKNLKKDFEVKTETKRNGLATISFFYKQKGRAMVRSKRTELGILTFQVLTDKAAKGEISFSKVNLFDRFGRDFVRSDLKINVEKKSIPFVVEAVKTKKSQKESRSASLTAGGISFSPKKGEVGDAITIRGNFSSTTCPPGSDGEYPACICDGGTYNISTNSCENALSIDCSAFFTDATCNTYPGCNWNRTTNICKGGQTASACSTFFTDATCNTYPGCSWSWATYSCAAYGWYTGGSTGGWYTGGSTGSSTSGSTGGSTGYTGGTTGGSTGWYTGGATSCSMSITEPTCFSSLGCSWDWATSTCRSSGSTGGSTGTVSICSAYVTEISCSPVSGCAWDRATYTCRSSGSTGGSTSTTSGGSTGWYTGSTTGGSTSTTSGGSTTTSSSSSSTTSGGSTTSSSTTSGGSTTSSSSSSSTTSGGSTTSSSTTSGGSTTSSTTSSGGSTTSSSTTSGGSTTSSSTTSGGSTTSSSTTSGGSTTSSSTTSGGSSTTTSGGSTTTTSGSTGTI